MCRNHSCVKTTRMSSVGEAMHYWFENCICSGKIDICDMRIAPKRSRGGNPVTVINLLEALSEAWTWLPVCIVQSLTLLAVKLALRVRKSYSRLFSVLVRSTLKSRLFNPPHREPRVTNHAQTCAPACFLVHISWRITAARRPTP